MTDEPASIAGRHKGWLYRAMEPLLPDWGAPYGARRVSGATVCGVPDEYNPSPRLSAKQFTDRGGNISISVMVGIDEKTGAGLWQYAEFTPEQCVQIVASILSRPSLEDVAAPLIEAAARALLTPAQGD